MKKWKKIILTVFITAVMAAGALILYVYLKPHRDVTNEKGIALSAQALYDAFKNNEANANAQYLNKAIELTGEVAEVTGNQEGNTVINFKTNDPLFMINCTFKIKPESIKPGQILTFKGICTGYIPDFNVVINEGILVK